MSSRQRRWLLLAVLAMLGLGGAAQAKVFYSRAEAVALAFPEADRIEDRTVVLEEEQVERVESLAHSTLDSKLVRIYTGYRGSELLGYAMIDVHNVRTLPEAFLVVLSAEGEVTNLRLLAFHEPLEYMPPARWYAQFQDKSDLEPLRLGGDVHGIVGATLSAEATTAGVRRALALYRVVVQKAN